MKYLFLIVVIVTTTSCYIDPIELDDDFDCVADYWVGNWEYQSTNDVVLDSIPDLEIIISNDQLMGDIIINNQYFNIKTIAGCTAGERSPLLDITYELKNENELHRKSSAFIFFGLVSIYKRE